MRINDIVKVKRKGNRYSTYLNFFEEAGMPYSVSCRFTYGGDHTELNDTLYRVLYVGKHARDVFILAIIESITTRKVYIWGVDGLEFVKRACESEEIE